jgi:hypothetical protein
MLDKLITATLLTVSISCLVDLGGQAQNSPKVSPQPHTTALQSTHGLGNH